MFDKYTRKAEKNSSEFFKMIEENAYTHFESLNRFSKHLYLYWLNQNKASLSLAGKHFNKENPRYTLEECARFPFIMPMMRRNPDKIYKPFAKLLTA